MKLFKRIFFFQLKFLPILGLIVFIIGAIVYEVNKKAKEDQSEFKTLTKKEFFDKAIKNQITYFNKVDNRMEMELPNNQKYSWKLQLDDEANELRDSVYAHFGSFSYGEDEIREEESYYLLAPIAILYIIVMVLLFNLVVVLWLFSFFDLMKSEFIENHNKWLWFVSFILLPLITPLFYWMISEKQKKNV